MQKVLNLKDALKLKNPKLNGRYLITEKIEGWYVTINFSAVTGMWSAPISSSGRVIPSLAWAADLFNMYFPKAFVDYTIIAEAYLEQTPFSILNGIFNRSVGDCTCKDVVFKVHDLIRPKDNILNAYARYLLLLEFEAKVNRPEFFQVLPILSIEQYNYDVWQSLFSSITNVGGEGIVAKNIDSLYSDGKRNSDLLKLKLECTVECIAVALEETIGDKGNSGLVLISKRANGVLVRTIISKHSDQDLFRSDNSSIIGKVIQVKAMEEFEDGQLRQPVFQHIRHDRLPCDINIGVMNEK